MLCHSCRLVRTMRPRYLPLTMEAEFQDHLGTVLPLILDGLSDEVREGRG